MPDFPELELSEFPEFTGVKPSRQSAQWNCRRLKLCYPIMPMLILSVMNLFPCVRQPSTRGFTLIEMLAALAVAGIVSGLSLISLRAIMGASEDTADRSTALVELNRGLDFISTEVKASSSLTVPPSCPPTLPAGAPACFQAVLEINAPAAVSGSPIYYYLTDAQIDEEIGPQVIYRHGPSFDASGNYDPGTTITAALI